MKALRKELSGMDASALSLVPRHEHWLRLMRERSGEIITNVLIPETDYLGFMAVHFHGKQRDHALAILKLEDHPDTVLIARSMVEGLCLLKWARQDAATRGLQWREFSLVLDWRDARRQLARGASPEVVRQIEARIAVHGDMLLSGAAMKALSQGEPLPADPYVKRWYRPQLKQIFEAVKGEALYEGPYHLASEWHHWSPGGLVFAMEYSEDSMSYSSGSPVLRLTALANAFQCLAETSMFVATHFDLPRASELVALTNDYIDELGGAP